MIDVRPDTVLSLCPNALRSLLIGAYIHEDVSTAVLEKKRSHHVVLLLMGLYRMLMAKDTICITMQISVIKR